MDFRQIYFLLFLCLQDQMEELTKQTQTRNDKMQLMMEHQIFRYDLQCLMELAPVMYPAPCDLQISKI